MYYVTGEAAPSLNTEVLAVCSCGSLFHTFGLDPVHYSEGASSGVIESRLTKEDYKNRSLLGE